MGHVVCLHVVLRQVREGAAVPLPVAQRFSVVLFRGVEVGLGLLALGEPEQREATTEAVIFGGQAHCRARAAIPVAFTHVAMRACAPQVRNALLVLLGREEPLGAGKFRVPIRVRVIGIFHGRVGGQENVVVARV